jgi:dihydroorotate dehydrogenase
MQNSNNQLDHAGNGFASPVAAGNSNRMKTYSDFRKAGYTAKQSNYMAKAVAEFEQLGEDKVRLAAVPEMENYFDVYGEPEGYVGKNGKRVSAEQEHKEIIEQIERDGCYCVVSYYRDENDNKWIAADSVGMCAGYKNVLCPVENAYVADLMRAAVDTYKSQNEYAI